MDGINTHTILQTHQRYKTTAPLARFNDDCYHACNQTFYTTITTKMPAPGSNIMVSKILTRGIINDSDKCYNYTRYVCSGTFYDYQDFLHMQYHHWS
jgi:hypothetical protein